MFYYNITMTKLYIIIQSAAYCAQLVDENSEIMSLSVKCIDTAFAIFAIANEARKMFHACHVNFVVNFFWSFASIIIRH